jgi:copper chaperone NosL
MKKISITFPAILFYLMFAGVAMSQTADDSGSYKSCGKCGMDREMFNYSRMLIEYDDGTTAPFCSIHCAAVDLANNIDKTPKSIKVADYNGKQLIDAENAFWVIGGVKSGVMSKRGKWAFEKKADAEAFIAANQGVAATFDDAMKAAYEDMYSDTKMIRDKRKMKRMNMQSSKPDSGRAE